jgi:hypothetical protein
MDDLDARLKARRRLDQYRLWSCEKQKIELMDSEEVKFQEVSKSMPPRKVEL